jgi:putative permease
MRYRRIAVNSAVIFATLVVVVLLYEFRDALIIFLLSLSVAAALRPFVEKGNQKGLPRTLALILVYLLVIGAITLIAIMVGGSLLNELQVLVDRLARAYDRIWLEWPEGTEVQKTLIAQLPAPADLYNVFSIDRQNSAMQALLGLTVSSATLFTKIFAIIFLSFYWSLDQVHFERLWLSLFPVESRARYRDIWRAVELDFGLYMRSEVLQSLLVGVILGVGFWAIGLPYPTLLAVFGALVWLIPWLGGVLAVLPVALVGFSTGLVTGITVSLYTILTLFVMDLVIEPRFLRRRQYSSLLTILLILVLSEPFGLFGFIIAPPLAAAIELVIRYSLQSRVTPFSLESIKRIIELRQRIHQVRETVHNSITVVEPQTLNILERLETLVDRADQVVEEQNRKNRG